MLQPHSYQPPEDGLPPQDVRILSLRAEPWPEDGRRVRVHLEVTPFLERPNIEVTILDSDNNEVSSISIIESIDALMTFTMHIRNVNRQDTTTYALAAALSYPEIGTVDSKNISFETII